MLFTITAISLVQNNDANAQDSNVLSVRHAQHGKLTRVVVELSEQLDFHVFSLPSPPRLVIDIPASNVADIKLDKQKSLVTQFRSGLYRFGITRLVFDLKKPFIVKNRFELQKTATHGFRLVTEVQATRNMNQLYSEKSDDWHKLVRSLNNKNIVSQTNKTEAQGAKIPLIVIDPGHGGLDPGAIGHKKSKEKDITLKVAKAMRDLLIKKKEYRVILTRSKDHYIRLRERYQVAEDANADLFLSLHADSIDNRKLRGASVYTLSRKASDREAEKLAANENRSDILAGVRATDLPDDSDVALILLDMTQQGTLNESARVAKIIIDQLKNDNIRLLRNSHRFAGFAVLKSPAIPSILIEMGFLTNYDDEHLLNNKAHIKKLTKSMKSAIDRYFKK